MALNLKELQRKFDELFSDVDSEDEFKKFVQQKIKDESSQFTQPAGIGVKLFIDEVRPIVDSYHKEEITLGKCTELLNELMVSKFSAPPPPLSNEASRTPEVKGYSREQMYKCWREAIDGNMMFDEFISSISRDGEGELDLEKIAIAEYDKLCSDDDQSEWFHFSDKDIWVNGFIAGRKVHVSSLPTPSTDEQQ